MKSNKKIKTSLRFTVESPELISKLKACNSDVKQYISELKTIIRQLQKQNLKIEALNVSLDSRVKLLEKEKANGEWQKLKVIRQIIHTNTSPKT